MPDKKETNRKGLPNRNNGEITRNVLPFGRPTLHLAGNNRSEEWRKIAADIQEAARLRALSESPEERKKVAIRDAEKYLFRSIWNGPIQNYPFACGFQYEIYLLQDWWKASKIEDVAKVSEESHRYYYSSGGGIGNRSTSDVVETYLTYGRKATYSGGLITATSKLKVYSSQNGAASLVHANPDVEVVSEGRNYKKRYLLKYAYGSPTLKPVDGYEAIFSRWKGNLKNVLALDTQSRSKAGLLR